MVNIQPWMPPLESFREFTNKGFRQLFKDKIKGAFLINIKSQVLSVLGGDLSKYYDSRWTDEVMLTGNEGLPEYDICRFIIGIHHTHSIFLSPDEIREKEKDDEYKKNLICEVIEKVRLRGYGSYHFRKRPILQGEEFMFYPVPYELFVLCTRAHELFVKNTGHIIYLQLYYGIINNGLAALSLLEDNFLSSAYPLCRGAIEMYCKLLILKNNFKAFEYYEKFLKFEIEQSCCSQNYPEEFNKLFDRRTNQKSHKKADYLHYGWLDHIDGYHDSVKQFPYSINGIISFLKERTDKKQKTVLECIQYFYKMCHGYTHGSVQNAIYPKLHYFEISIMLYHTIRNTFLLLCRELNIETLINGLDVIAMIDRDFIELYDQYRNRSTENFEIP